MSDVYDIDADYYRRLLEHATRLFTEQDVTRLCESILSEVIEVAKAEGGSLYLLSAHDQVQQLEFAILHNEVLGIKHGGNREIPEEFVPIPLWNDDGTANHNHIATHAAISRQVVCVDDVYQATGFDFSGAREFDEAQKYHTQSVLAIPLINDANNIVGVIQLVNARNKHSEVVPFDRSLVEALEIMCRFASIALSQQLVAREQKEILTDLSAESSTEKMLERILEELQDMTYADGGTLYLLEEQDGQEQNEVPSQ